MCVRTAVIANSAGLGSVPMVHAWGAGLRGHHMLPLHPPPEMGGSTRRLDIHRGIDSTTWIL